MPAHHPASERRRDARTPLTRPVKLRCRQTGRYYGGTTADLSAGGARLVVNHPALLVSGQPVEVGIAWTSRDMLLCRAHMIGARVVRSLGMGQQQQVAVRFDARQALALGA